MQHLVVLNDGLKANAKPSDTLTIKLPHGPEIDMLSLTLDAVHRLAQYGARQWVQDSIAGTAKELKEEGRSEDEIKQVLLDDQASRWASILDGSVGTRASGPRIRGIDRVMRDVALERIKAVLTKLNKKLPKGDALQTMLAAYIAKNTDSLKAEAERRMNETTASDEEAAETAKLLGLAA